MVFDTLTSVMRNFGPQAQYEQKAREKFEVFKPIYNVIIKNGGDLTAHLQNCGYTKKGNMYTNNDVVILVYKDDQKQYLLDLIKQKCKKNLYMAHNNALNCGRLFVVGLYKDQMFVFSPDYDQPHPLQIPKSLVVEKLEKIIKGGK